MALNSRLALQPVALVALVGLLFIHVCLPEEGLWELKV